MSVRTTECLIGEIRGLARDRIDSEQLDHILDEVRAHLDASIQARLELGGSIDQAELDAIRAFGDPREFVHALSARSDKNSGSYFDLTTFISMLVPAILLSAYLALRPDHNEGFGTSILLFCGFAFATFKTFVTSRNAKCFQLLPLIATFFIATILFAFAFSVDDNRGSWRMFPDTINHLAEGTYFARWLTGIYFLASTGGWLSRSLFRLRANGHNAS